MTSTEQIQLLREALRKTRVYVQSGRLDCTCEDGDDCVWHDEDATTREDALGLIDRALLAATEPTPENPPHGYLREDGARWNDRAKYWVPDPWKKAEPTPPTGEAPEEGACMYPMCDCNPCHTKR